MGDNPQDRIDYALAIEYVLPDAKYRSAKTYERLVRTWEDNRPVPARAVLDAAWLEISEQEEAPTLEDVVKSLENRVTALERFLDVK